MLIKREMAGNAMRIRLASYPENFQGNVALITTLLSLLPLRVQMEPQTVTRERCRYLEGKTYDGWIDDN